MFLTKSTTSFPIKICLGLLVQLFLWTPTDLNLSGLIIILFWENHLNAFWDSVVRISNSNVRDFANDDNILSSAKLCTDAFLMEKEKSFLNALDNIGPTIEPCGTPEVVTYNVVGIVYGFSNTCKYISEHCH